MIKLLGFDMDGTLVHYDYVENYSSSWDALGSISGKWDQWEAALKYYLNHPELYDEWFYHDLGLLEGVDFSKAAEVLFPIPYCNGVEEFFDNRDRKYITGIVSSGINLVSDKIKERFSLDFAIANDIYVEDGRFNGNGRLVVGMDSKVVKLREVAEEYGVKLEEILFVGDNFNDVPVFEVVGTSVAYNPKDENLKGMADYVIYDFRELEDILKDVGS